MAKISELELIDAPVGDEQVIALKDGEGKRVSFAAIVTAAVAPHVAVAQGAAAEAVGTLANARISSADLLAAATATISPGGGATRTPGTQWGVTVPAGQAGDTTAQIRYTLPYVPQDGETTLFEVRVETTDAFTRTVYADLVVSTAANPFGILRAAGLTVTPSIEGAARVYRYKYEFQGDELGFWPRIQTVTAAPAATEERWEIVGLTESRDFTLGVGGTAADEMLASRVPFIMNPIVQPMRVGSGDILPKLGAFVASNGGAQPGDTPFELVIPAGQSGDSAQVQARWSVDGAALADKRIDPFACTNVPAGIAVTERGRHDQCESKGGEGRDDQQEQVTRSYLQLGLIISAQT